jgi:hypothetical protein
MATTSASCAMPDERRVDHGYGQDSGPAGESGAAGSDLVGSRPCRSANGILMVFVSLVRWLCGASSELQAAPRTARTRISAEQQQDLLTMVSGDTEVSAGAVARLLCSFSTP